ncbi:hypothetical protein LINGRAHAP2_LOCUS8667 [Linum grandiflorum]
MLFILFSVQLGLRCRGFVPGVAAECPRWVDGFLVRKVHEIPATSSSPPPEAKYAMYPDTMFSNALLSSANDAIGTYSWWWPSG